MGEVGRDNEMCWGGGGGKSLVRGYLSIIE